VKTLVTIILWIIAIYGTFSVIRWCAGPRLEDLMRGYGDPLTGKQRRKKQRESDMPSVKIILKCKFLMVWSKLNLISKRITNHLWNFFYPAGSKPFWESTMWRIYYWRLRRWKAQTQLVILQLQRKLEIFTRWVKRQRAVFSLWRTHYWDYMGEGMIWVAIKCCLVDQGLDVKLKKLRQDTNLVLQLFHTKSLWKSKWERAMHQLTQRPQIYLASLHLSFLTVRNRIYVGRQRYCLRLGVISSQILSWMGNLYVAWLYNISYEESPRWAYLPNLWQYPKATSTTGRVDDYAAAERCTAMRRAHRVSRSSRLVLLFLCGLKLLHDAQRLRDPGQAMLRSQVDQQRTSATGSIIMEPSWHKWCYQDEETDLGRVKYPETICPKETLMAKIWEGRMLRISVKGVVGRAIRECGIESVYGYAHPSCKVRECFRTHRLPLTTVAFEGPIDKG